MYSLTKIYSECCAQRIDNYNKREKITFPIIDLAFEQGFVLAVEVKRKIVNSNKMNPVKLIVIEYEEGKL